MTRYFLAIPLPEETKDRLLELQPPTVSGMRLIGRSELHLTLHFLGELSSVSVALVRNALAAIKRIPFTIDIRGVSRFFGEGQAQILWIGIENNSDLIELHQTIGAVLKEAIGFRVEERPYSPHITLARMNDPISSCIIEDYLEKNKDIQISSVPIDQFVLYSSIFVDRVPRYREEAIFRFS